MKTAPEFRHVLRFGQFELDPSSGELRKGGVRIRVADQAIQVLALLLARPGEVVTREELASVLWPAGTHVDFENGLNAAVKKLRIALGDSGVSPRYVETLPRRGYRLIAPVDLPEALRPVSVPARQPPAASLLRNRIVSMIVLTILAGTVGAFVLSLAQRHGGEPKRLAGAGWGRPSGNAEANGYFAKAELFLGVGTFDLARSRQLLQRALQLDPSFGKARCEYGFTHLLMVNAGYSNDASWFDRAEGEIRQGLRDDPTFCHGHTALAALYLHRGLKESATEEIEQALRINPADVDAKHWLAVHHWYSGDGVSAERLEQENVARNGRFFPARMTLGAIAIERGDWEGALRNYGSVLEYDPQNSSVLGLLTRAYMDIGDLTNARQTLSQLRPDDRRSFCTRALEAVLLAREGKRQAAANAMDPEVLKYLALNRFWTLTGAEFYNLMGNRPQALEWLDRAVHQGDHRAAWFLRDPALQSLRGERRYQQIVNSAAARQAFQLRR